MPHISEAMQRSASRSALEKIGHVVLRSLLSRRSLTDKVDDVKDTFSSWDSCMDATYCKWPVIAAIAIGGLILLSIATCVIRCACCGMSCCCSCFSFLSCLDCCGGCCDGKKDKPHKHLDVYSTTPAPTQGYHSTPPMMRSGATSATGAGGGGDTVSAPPMYAQFDVGKNGLAVEPKALSEDALPPMPSWETASTRRIATEEKEGVELGNLSPSGQQVPLMSAVSPALTAVSPEYHQANFNHPQQQGQGNRAMNQHENVSPVDVYGNNHPGNIQNRNFTPQNGPSRYGSPAPGELGRGYGSPAPGHVQQRKFPRRTPSYDMYSDNGFASPGGFRCPPGSYTPEQRPYTPQGDERRYSNPMSGGFQDQGYNVPARRQSHGPPNNRLISNPVNQGFDMNHNQNYASPQPYNPPRQPQQQGYFDNVSNFSAVPPSYATRSSTPHEERVPYPGYQPYQPAPRAPQTPGGGGRQPQRWDPVNQGY